MSNVEGKSGKPFPVFQSDEEAARFVDEADLSEYDFSGFNPMRLELEKKTKQVNFRQCLSFNFFAPWLSSGSDHDFPYAYPASH